MKARKLYLASVVILSFAAVLAVSLVSFVSAEPVAANADVTAPANGTADSLNITVAAQQYIGFFGNLTMQVRKNGGSSGTSLYNRTAQNGCIFINDGDVAAPTWPAVQSPPDANSDTNFSVTGAYLTANHFSTVFGSLCGVSNAFTANTTDNYVVGIFRDGNQSGRKHFLGANIQEKTSTNGFGPVEYEIIAPKTAIYGNAGYDFYVELAP